MTYTALTDQELAEKFNGKDNLAFETIYDRYWLLLFRHARKMLNDEQQAKDVVQDVFMTLLAKAGMLVLNGPLSTYLYAVTRNNVINLIRRDKVKTDYLQYLQYQSEGVYSTESTLLEKELSMQIEQEIAALPPKMREVFELSRKAYMSTAEIAKMRNVSENTIKTQLYGAIRILRGKLGSYFLLQFMLFILWMNRMLNG